MVSTLFRGLPELFFPGVARKLQFVLSRQVQEVITTKQN